MCESCESSDYAPVQSGSVARVTEGRSGLADGADWYEGLFLGNAMPVLLIDPATADIVDANPAAVAYYGYTGQELRSLAVADLDIRSEAEVREDLIRASEGECAHFSVRHEVADGTIHEASVHTSILQAHSGPLIFAAIHDVTDQRHAEQERHYLAAIIEETLDLAVIRDLNLRVISANHAFLRAVGAKTVADVVGKTDRELFGERLRAEVIEARMREERQVQGLFPGELIVTEEEITDSDGARRTLLARRFPVFDDDSRLVATACIASDITERKLAEEKLRRSEAQARNFGTQLVRLHKLGNDLAKVQGVDNLCSLAVERGRELLGFDRMSIWLRDEQGRIVGTFGTDEQGCTRDERGTILPEWPEHPAHDLLQKRASLLTSDRADLYDAARVVGHGPRSMAGLWDGEDVIGYISADNLISQTPTTELQNEMLAEYAATIGHLLTQKKAEEELRQSEERLRMILEHSHDAISIKTADPQTGDYRLIMFNDRLVEMSGRSREELLAQGNLDDILTVDDPKGTRQAWLNCLRNGSPFTGRGSWKRPDGRENYFEWSAVRVIIGGDVHVIGMDRDVTERVLAERQRRDLETQMQHAQKLESLGVLAGGIAHDFNNLLVAMLGNADLALMDLPSGGVRQSIEEVKRAALRASDLTNQMLAYSGRGSFVIAPLDLNDLVEQMAHLLDVSISKKITLRFDLAPALAHFDADGAQIQQVVMNLITNAADAIGNESGTITLRTAMREMTREALAGCYVDDALPAGRYVCLEVQDTGCGMADEQKQRVFDPFYTTKFTGRGLGLAAVLGIIRGHDGAVQIDSALGRGTTFRILLPANGDGSENNDADANAAVSHARQSWRGSGTVLLVDDLPDVRRVGRAMLQRLGFDVLEAGDGVEAIDIYARRAKEISLVVLDMTMPNMDGPEALQKLRDIDADVPVVLCSGYSEQETTARMHLAGPAGFLHKPFDFDQLTDVLKRVCEAEDTGEDGSQ